jgi:hypothetical protein
MDIGLLGLHSPVGSFPAATEGGGLSEGGKSTGTADAEAREKRRRKNDGRARGEPARDRREEKAP